MVALSATPLLDPTAPVRLANVPNPLAYVPQFGSGLPSPMVRLTPGLRTALPGPTLPCLPSLALALACLTALPCSWELGRIPSGISHHIHAAALPAHRG